MTHIAYCAIHAFPLPRPYWLTHLTEWLHAPVADRRMQMPLMVDSINNDKRPEEDDWLLDITPNIQFWWRSSPFGPEPRTEEIDLHISTFLSCVCTGLC